MDAVTAIHASVAIVAVGVLFTSVETRFGYSFEERTVRTVSGHGS